MFNNESVTPFTLTNTGLARPEMTPADYEVWREFVNHRCGLDFAPSRRHFLQARLWERMQVHQIKQYSAYYHYVLYNSQGEQEWSLLLDLLLNNESSFFRHAPSYAALCDHVLPALLAERRRQNRRQLAFWSAGCANGQEAYSLAMAFKATAPAHETHLWRLDVWGTDISQRSLRKAKNGRYKPYDIRTMPEPFRRRYMKQVQNGSETYFEVTADIREIVNFGELNFIDTGNYWLEGQDIIFCQNVLIYFRAEERLKITEQLCHNLNPGGYLFLAPAELIGFKHEAIRPVRLEETLIYQRIV
jgi:chemotaxis methyl-accepting protein methylase